MRRVYVFLLLFALAVSAGTIIAQLSPELIRACSSPAVTIDGIPFVPGGYAWTEEGFPTLPRLPWYVPLDPGTRAVSVTSEAVWENFEEIENIPPLSAPAPLTVESSVRPATPLDEIYSVNRFWPLEAALLAGTGLRDGRPAAQLVVTPLRWNPVTGMLQRLVSLEVLVETAPSDHHPLPCGDSDEDVQRMLIVTDQTMEIIFSQLAVRRNDQGILTEVVTMNDIYASASGRDNAEKLRNFVKDYYSENGLDYLLLGGDTNLVPVRFAYAMTCEAGIHPREDTLPCDLYFSDLDGTWDANGNDIFGEVDDDVDLHPDIFVGRATVENTTEATVFINNIAFYEDCASDDFYQDVLFLAEVLWTNPYTNSGESKDYIEEHFLPGFLNITKLYQALGNENVASAMAALNEGQNFVNHDGHAWYTCMGVGDGYLYSADMDAINSGQRFASVLYSIGCWSAAFDFDAIAEHFITNPNGGGVGFIGNSSYGWGSPGNPLYGYSDALDHLFFDYLYSDWSMTLGELLAYTKEYFIPYSQWENVYRWHQYDVNLLGDPSLRPYRALPAEISVSCPQIVTVNTSIFPVTVSGCSPEGLSLCVHDDGDNWSVVVLDATGHSDIIFDGPVTGNVTVTVTGPGARRTSFEVEQASGPDPVISEMVINNSEGYDHLTPGCNASLDITLLNQGNEDLTSVEINVTSIEGPATLNQSSSYFGDITAGNESTGSPSLSLVVNDDAFTGNVVTLSGQLSAAEDTWDFVLPLLVHAPGLYFTTYSIDDSQGGNDNGIPEPGEYFDLDVNIANFGLLDASSISAVMSEYPNWVSWIEDSAYVDSIIVDGTCTFEFVCQLAYSAPSPSFPWFFFDIISETTGYASEDSLRLTVGETGISNDVESGESGWTHSGTGDLWNITDSESHSPTHSWHCGGTGGYVNGMDCSLLSPEMILAPEASMDFWARFDVAIYGSDGLYIVVNDLMAGSADTLDYIGSGGALGRDFWGAGTEWCLWSYDLSQYDAGTSVQIEFRFCSDDDGDTGPGFFIDDISVEGAYTGSTGASGPQPIQPTLGLPRPNPASAMVTVPLFIDASGEWDIGIYDISGRLVISRRGAAPIEHLLQINVSDLSSGIYLIRLSGAAEATGRLVILR